MPARTEDVDRDERAGQDHVLEERPDRGERSGRIATVRRSFSWSLLTGRRSRCITSEASRGLSEGGPSLGQRLLSV
jgi:hypothetical protein